jgi:hypothetical protein
MRNLIAAATLSAFMLAGATSAVAEEKPTGEQKLAELLEGRVAGEPQSCISANRVNDLQVIDKTALVYRDRDILWVNRTVRPDDLNRDDLMVINRTSTMQLCKLDRITMTDKYSGFLTSVVLLKDFVPYTKVEADK